MSLIMDIHAEDDADEASGFVMSGLALGVTTGPLIGGGLAAILPDWTGMLLVPLQVFLSA